MTGKGSYLSGGRDVSLSHCPKLEILRWPHLSDSLLCVGQGLEGSKGRIVRQFISPANRDRNVIFHLCVQGKEKD